MSQKSQIYLEFDRPCHEHFCHALELVTAEPGCLSIHPHVDDAQDSFPEVSGARPLPDISIHGPIDLNKATLNSCLQEQ